MHAVQLAPDVQRQSRITRPPQRPKDGWTLVVQPLSRRRNQVSKQSALPRRPTGFPNQPVLCNHAHQRPVPRVLQGLFGLGF